MANIAKLLTEHINIWTAADTEKKSGRGRASSNLGSVYGVKKLRELILELAVRGKLVPQDANDEPARELIKRIQAEKAKLVAEGKIKKEKPLEPISEDEKFLELPNGWEWIRVGSLGNWGAGATPLRSVSSYYGGSMPWFKSGELTADFIDTAEETVTDLALKDCSLRLNQPGDVLLAMYGATIGKASILKIAGTTNQAVCACTPNGSIFNRYLLLMLKAMKSNFVGQGAGGAQPNISREKIIATLTTLPPLSEQQRIVAKVDELMALCDRLEQQHSNAQEAHEKLVSQLLAALTQSQNAAEFNANWQRILAHFDVLFTTEVSINALKQTLLQLAVMGKLVPQDPNDEPASELLKRIQAEKGKLIAEGKLKKEKPLSLINEEEKPFELPKGWEWRKLGNLLAFEYGDNLPEPKRSNTGEYPVYGSNGIVGSHNISFVQSKCIVIGRKGSAGALNLNLQDGCCVTDVAYYCIPPKEIDLIFTFNLLHTLGLDELGKGIKPGLNRNEAYELVIAIPPFAEQHRIVAKIDALIALCDQLKTRITESNHLQQKLANVMVEHATA